MGQNILQKGEKVGTERHHKQEQQFAVRLTPVQRERERLTSLSMHISCPHVSKASSLQLKVATFRDTIVWAVMVVLNEGLGITKDLALLNGMHALPTRQAKRSRILNPRFEWLMVA